MHTIRSIWETYSGGILFLYLHTLIKKNFEMADLTNMFKDLLTDDLVDQLGSQIGINDRQKTTQAASGAFSVLLEAMKRNAASGQGASALNQALEKDHDGSILEDIMGYVSGQTSQPERTTNGAGILKHVLGNKQSGVIDMLSQVAGLDKSTSGNLLIKMAPLVMGALGKQKRTQNLDSGGLLDMLTKSAQPKEQDSAFGGLLNAVLDQDKDGDVKDDLMRMGMKALGNFFKKKR